MAGIVDEHKKTYDEDCMRTFIDVYIKQMETSSDAGYNGKPLLFVTSKFFITAVININTK